MAGTFAGIPAIICKQPQYVLFADISQRAAINTRSKDRNGSSWQENKLGAVFCSKDIRKRKTKKGNGATGSSGRNTYPYWGRRALEKLCGTDNFNL